MHQSLVEQMLAGAADLEDYVFSSAVREWWRHGDGAPVPYEWATG